MIDTRAAGDLVSGVDALVGAALADGIGRPERAARAAKAAQAAGDLATLRERGLRAARVTLDDLVDWSST